MSERVITVVLTVADKEAAGVIWDKHQSGELLAGCKVGAIHSGNALDELETLQEESWGEDL